MFYSIGIHCVKGITLCSTYNESTYMISCDYIRGCDKTGCSYSLTSVNDSLTSTIQGSNIDIIEIHGITYNLTVTDMNGSLVQLEHYTFKDVNSCSTFG